MAYLDLSTKRTIETCNYNYYPISSTHMDRILPVHDLLFLLDGEWEIYEEETPYILKPGSLLFLERGRHHYGLKENKAGTKDMFIHIHGLETDTAMAARDSSWHIHISTFLDCNYNMEIKKLFEEVIQLFWQEVPHKGLKLWSVLLALLLEIVQESSRDNRFTDELIGEILYTLDTSTHKFFHLNELAAVYHISVKTLSNRFKKCTGESLHQYQINRKLDMASSLIQSDPERTFRNIALNYGFYDEFQFSKLFKRRFGFPPSSIKKKP